MALILLAEDDEGIRTPLAQALECEGHVVDAVATGTPIDDEALTIYTDGSSYQGPRCGVSIGVV